MISPNGLEIADLTAGYRGRSVLKNLSMPMMRTGEVTALVGPNAAGKSTLLRALAGLIRADGSARLDGADILAMGSAQRSRLVTMMPQSLPQGIALNVLEGMLAAIKGGGSSGLSPDGAIGRATMVLERVGIADLALKPFDHLSGGQRQLASFAQAIVREPKLLLLDEPTSALDLRHQVEVMNLARDFAREGRVVVVVLHDLNLAMRWTDRIALMHRGEVYASGRAVDVITPEALRDVYEVLASVESGPDGHSQVFIRQPV